MRELVYYIGVTLDGFIAGPDGQFDAFLAEGDHMTEVLGDFADALPTAAAEHLGITQPGTRFDTVLMGSATYGVGLPDAPSPYRHLEQIVFSRRDLPAAENLQVTSEDPVSVVRALKEREGADLWLCGGGVLAARLRGEIDRLVLKRQPLLLGAGIPLFAPCEYAPVRWEAVRRTPYASGVTIEEYVRA